MSLYAMRHSITVYIISLANSAVEVPITLLIEVDRVGLHALISIPTHNRKQ